MCSVVSSSGSEHLALVYLRSELRHGAKQDERSFCLEKSRSTAGAPTEVSYQQICHIDRSPRYSQQHKEEDFST